MKPKLIPRLVFIWLICFAFSLTVRSERLPVKIYTSADGLGSMKDMYGMKQGDYLQTNIMQNAEVFARMWEKAVKNSKGGPL